MKPGQVGRVVTASSLFDGHDAAINFIRRLLQSAGMEVIHIGHNRSVHQIVTTAVQEDANAVCISSYQGGHMEFFRYLQHQLRAHGAYDISIFGGGGGTILPSEIAQLHAEGITQIYHAEDGRRLGPTALAQDVIQRTNEVTRDDNYYQAILEKLATGQSLSDLELAKAITQAENGDARFANHPPSNAIKSKVIGITGPGGAGKSSLVDELVTRYLYTTTKGRIAILGFDPTKRKTGGSLLGDRIRMNSIYDPRVFMRSMATRGAPKEMGAAVEYALNLLKLDGFELIILETTGIGQGDAAVAELSDLSVYVMTHEYGASSQLEKIDMIDYADVVTVNKFDHMGSEEALNDVGHAWAQSHGRVFSKETQNLLPVFGTIASNFNDPGVTRLYNYLADKLDLKADLKRLHDRSHTEVFTIIPQERTFYLVEVAAQLREYRKETLEKAEQATHLQQLQSLHHSAEEIQQAQQILGESSQTLIDEFFRLQHTYRHPLLEFTVRGRVFTRPLFTESLAGIKVPKIAVPHLKDWGDILTFMRLENFPGRFPYSAGTFDLKSAIEDPKRQFAGEGSPERTNKRFHYLCQHDTAKRLSTAFDSVTLYGEDPAERQDISGKIGNSGVSIATLDDMKALYAGFDLTDPLTSVSLTINGPAPMLLAMFLNAAIDFEVDKHPNEPYESVKKRVLKTVRGTVQADILKEEQAQNTCIFSSKFALKMMGDIEEYFIAHQVRNFYSVSISGYHIAEAGANPITQLAFTLANGFTYVEYYLSRGMPVDEFAPHLSFFFSTGLDPEYSVIGRVARRIWAVAMRHKYGANDRSCKLKYHVQTSGRSLHAQEIAFNEIRTTLQALTAYYDNCNSLHTNAYDEAITTPTEESVRRAMAIQLIITKEFGPAKCDNALQGSYLFEELTDLVEEAVLTEFEAISRRGGVLGAMEKQYQRHQIQNESMKYEMLKASGELPLIGVNTYLSETDQPDYDHIAVVRATPEEKAQQIRRTREFISHAGAKNLEALERLRQTALSGGNIFEELMETVKYASLGQITALLYRCGGEYRRSM